MFLIGLVVFGLIIVGELAIAPPLAHTTIAGGSQVSVHRTYWLIGDGFQGWNLTKPGPYLWANNGDLVTLMMKSHDGILHSWFIDFNNNYQPDANETDLLSPGFQDTTSYLNYTFVPVIGSNIPRAGNWTYRCQYHPIFMYGTIRVNPGPDFSIEAQPTNLSLVSGSSKTTTIIFSSENGFGGTVQISDSVNETGLNLILNASSVTLVPSLSSAAKLTLTGSSPSVFRVVLTGSSGRISHSIGLTVIVTPNTADFTISSKNTISILQGSSITQAITLTGYNNFSGRIDLSTSVTPTGPEVSLNQSVIELATNGSSTTTITISASFSQFTFIIPDSNYTTILTGTSGSLSHQVAITIRVQDFVETAYPTSVTMGVDVQSSSTIVLTPVNGFNGQVTLEYSLSPNTGLSCTLSPTMQALPGNSSLSCTASAPGNYTVTITTRAGSVTHSTSLRLSATSSWSPAPAATLLSPTTVGIVSAAALLGGIAIYLILRKSRTGRFNTSSVA